MKDENLTFSFRLQPEATYIIWITPSFRVEQTTKPPSLFHRWMMRLAFGWRFEILKARAE
jgi:hypothetical protein